jgi:prevent-host-death family protein
MKNVSVTELKANLSRYLEMVQRGSEVQVLDRNRPIARLVGLRPVRAVTRKQDEEKLERLERAGIVRRPIRDGRVVLAGWKPLELPNPDGKTWAEYLDEEREDRV